MLFPEPLNVVWVATVFLLSLFRCFANMVKEGVVGAVVGEGAGCHVHPKVLGSALDR